MAQSRGVVRYCPDEEYHAQTNLPLFPLEGAKAVLIDSSGKRIDSLQTNGEGIINFINVPSGQYTVKLAHEKAQSSLTLPVTVSGKTTAYLQTEGFDCINYQLYKITKRKWTFIHLVNNSDNTIAKGNFREIRKQEKYGGSGFELNNVAFFDCGEGDSRLMYLVQPAFTPDPDPIDSIAQRPQLYSPTYVYHRDKSDYNISGDLGDYKFMQKKIEQIAAMYPSDSVAIFIYSHGSGIDESIGFNDTRSISPNPTTQKEITIPQFREMLTNLHAKGINIGIVSTTACFMGMFEVGYELKDTGIQYYLSAETAGSGLFQNTQDIQFINDFKEGRGTCYSMGVEICKKPASNILALCDLKKMGQMTDLYNDFANKLDKTPIKYTQSLITNAVHVNGKGGVEGEYTYNYFDLGDFALLISKSEFTDTYELRPAAQKLYDYLKDRSGYIAAMGVAENTDWHKRLTGVSTLLVSPGVNYSQLSNIYRNLRYYKDGNTAWDSYLSKIDWNNPNLEEWNGSITTPTKMTDTEININFPSELAWVAQQVNTGVQNFSGKKILLNRDLDLGGRKQQNWIPIGTLEKPFKGDFDANNFRIFNLYINTSKLRQVGLFGYASDAGFTRCVISSGSITVSEDPTQEDTTPLCVGAICGTVNSVSTFNTFSRCIADVNMDIKPKQSLTNIGGLFGEAKGSFNILMCESYSSISVISESGRMVSVGGLVGNCAGSSMSQCGIRSCIYDNAQIFVNSSTDASAGGIVGSNENPKLTFYWAENSSIVNVKADGYAYAGGVIGSSTKDITLINGNNVGTVTASVKKPGTYSRAYAGGLIGAAGARVYGSSSSGTINGNDLIGGLAGEIDGSILACSCIPQTNGWIIAGRIPEDKTLTATDVYYHDYNYGKNPVGEGSLIRKNCVPFSATAWPVKTMKGWGHDAPEGVNQEDWSDIWAKIGSWNNGKPEFPEATHLHLQD